MTQIAAELMGVPIEDVTFELGDSSLPSAPVEGDSFTAASVGSAVKAACDKAREQLLSLARQHRTTRRSPASPRRCDICRPADPLADRPVEDRFTSRRDARWQARRRSSGGIGSALTPNRPTTRAYSHSAVFAEVHVDEDLGTIHVAESGERSGSGPHSEPDDRAQSDSRRRRLGHRDGARRGERASIRQFGRFINHSFGEYHVPVNADIHDIDVIFVEEHDDVVNPIGAKGLGEIGVVGVAAAIANAVFHATGKRIRELPITLDKVM